MDHNTDAGDGTVRFGERRKNIERGQRSHVFEPHAILTFGLEAGVQIPIHSTSSIEVEITDPAQNQYLSLLQSTDLYKDTQATIENEIGKVANIVLPYAAIRLGWTF